MSKEYAMFVVIAGNDIVLNILTDCPLYDYHAGLCSKCPYHKGLNIKIFREGRCGAAELFKSIEEFRVKSKCPDYRERNNGGDCHHCEHFLGFADNRGFFCSANKEK